MLGGDLRLYQGPLELSKDISYKKSSQYGDRKCMTLDDSKKIENLLDKYEKRGSDDANVVSGSDFLEILQAFRMRMVPEYNNIISNFRTDNGIISNSNETERESKLDVDDHDGEGKYEEKTSDDAPREFDIQDIDEIPSNIVSKFLCEEYRPFYIYGKELCRAAARGDCKAISELVARGCSITSTDGQGMNPLHYACQFGNMDGCSLILEYYQDEDLKKHMNRGDSNGWTPLFYAVSGGHLEVVKLLCEQESIIESLSSTRNSNGRTALHIAVLRERRPIVEYMVSIGDEQLVNELDDTGLAPLHLAALTLDSVIIGSLVQGGANLEIEDQRGRMPRDLITDQDIVELLTGTASIQDES